jgi:hypothetical protein
MAIQLYADNTADLLDLVETAQDRLVSLNLAFKHIEAVNGKLDDDAQKRFIRRIKLVMEDCTEMLNILD